MSGLPQLSGQEVARALAKAGFAEVSQRGSHRKLRDRDGHTVIVPMQKVVAKGTLASILRQAAIEGDALRALL